MPLSHQTFKSPIFIYTIKCLLGVSIGYWLYIRFPGHQFFWSLISIILVIAPDPRHSSQLAFDRMKANVIGSLTGLFLFLIGEPGLLLISLGVAITIGLCALFNLMNASRSSLAALLIVTMYEKNGNSWHIALERVGCVIIGCLIGLIISVVFGYIAKE